jgi:hypothetical protein
MYSPYGWLFILIRGIFYAGIIAFFMAASAFGSG